MANNRKRRTKPKPRQKPKAQPKADGQPGENGQPANLTDDQKKIQQLNKYLDYAHAQAALEQLAGYFAQIHARVALEAADTMQAGPQVDLERLRSRLKNVNKVLAASTRLGSCTPGGVVSTMTYGDCSGIAGCTATWNPL
jgi:hypothetical protein